MEQSELEKRLIFLQSFKGKVITGSPSPFMNWLKPVVISAEAGTLEFSYIVRKEMTNPMGTLHGGVTAGIIDDLIGATVYASGVSSLFTTVNNAIDYFSTAREGDEIVAKTTIIKKGRRVINLQCEIFLPAKNNRMIARGYSNMLNVGQEGN